MKAIKYFTAPWCGPCQHFGPIMDELRLSGINIQKINIDNQQSMAMDYNVRKVPTCIIVDSSGKELDRLVGAQPKHVVKQRFENA